MAIQRSAWVLAGGNLFSPESQPRSEEPERLTRLVADSLLGAYTKTHGKRRWCDKSLSTAEHASFVAQSFPDATFICLVRECTDTIASLLEASPFGFSAFGLEHYIRANPGNLVTALAAYWADKTDAVMRFHAGGHARTIRVRYEDLVMKTPECLEAICETAGLKWDPAFFSEQRVFSGETLGLNCGDAKIRYRRSVNVDSVGRGWTIPRDLFPPPLLERVNVMHTELGYPILDLARPFETLPQHDVDVKQMTEIDTRLRARVAGLSQTAGRRDETSVMLAVLDAQVAWRVDYSACTVERASVGEDDLERDWMIVTDAETIAGIASGKVNPAVAMRQGRLQAFHPGERPTVAEQISQVERVLELVK